MWRRGCQIRFLSFTKSVQLLTVKPQVYFIHFYPFDSQQVIFCAAKFACLSLCTKCFLLFLFHFVCFNFFARCTVDNGAPTRSFSQDYFICLILSLEGILGCKNATCSFARVTTAKTLETKSLCKSIHSLLDDMIANGKNLGTNFYLKKKFLTCFSLCFHILEFMIQDCLIDR